MTVYRRILLVEDDPNDRELTLTAIGEYNLANKVDVVSDGEEALDYLFRRGAWADRPQGHPLVVLLDLKMPKVDGLEVLKQIKADPELQVTPVVMLTSSREEQDLVRSYRLGVNAFVVKPVGFAEFMKAMSQLGIFWAMINEPCPYTPAGEGEEP